MSEETCACGRNPDPGVCQPEDCALRRATGSHCSCIHPPFGDVARDVPCGCHDGACCVTPPGKAER